jgi:hypothetical protein
MVSGSGMIGRGPENEAAKEVRVRDWWVRCVVKASWAVLSLFVVSLQALCCHSRWVSHTSSLRFQWQSDYQDPAIVP